MRPWLNIMELVASILQCDYHVCTNYLLRPLNTVAYVPCGYGGGGGSEVRAVIPATFVSVTIVVLR